MSVRTTTFFAISVVLSIIGVTWSAVDDAKVQRMVLLQGMIAIGAGLTYYAFYSNYEKSQKEFLEKKKAGPKESKS